jgi:hypothetical protein
VATDCVAKRRGRASIPAEGCANYLLRLEILNTNRSSQPVAGALSDRTEGLPYTMIIWCRSRTRERRLDRPPRYAVDGRNRHRNHEFRTPQKVGRFAAAVLSLKGHHTVRQLRLAHRVVTLDSGNAGGTDWRRCKRPVGPDRDEREGGLRPGLLARPGPDRAVRAADPGDGSGSAGSGPSPGRAGNRSGGTSSGSARSGEDQSGP